MKTITVRFDRRSFGIFLILFALEAAIALGLDDPFVRPLVGDALVVILVFYGVRSFIQTRTRWLVLATLAFAWAVEFSQYFRLVERLGLGDNRLAIVVLGSVFDWRDLVAYTIGAAILLAVVRD
ncbi:MAG: DUF2809 domain-containing protein [Oscillatoriales cyanobacterium]|jgi:Protein of unknown function (DUF2809)|nr:MAG: DUF2809 domain-containing protein [Oscillatoriales cyanobacterium]